MESTWLSIMPVTGIFLLEVLKNRNFNDVDVPRVHYNIRSITEIYAQLATVHHNASSFNQKRKPN